MFSRTLLSAFFAGPLGAAVCMSSAHAATRVDKSGRDHRGPDRRQARLLAGQRPAALPANSHRGVLCGPYRQNSKPLDNQSFNESSDKDQRKMPNQLLPGQRLIPGQSLISNNTYYELRYQQDGNLVLYDCTYNPPKALWDTGTGGREACYVSYQTDGNF